MRNKRCYRSEKYLNHIRQLPCCVTGKTVGVVAHHVRLGQNGGIGLKPSDTRCLPLTYDEHEKLHRQGEKTYFEDKFDPDSMIAVKLFGYLMSIGKQKDVLMALEDLVEGQSIDAIE